MVQTTKVMSTQGWSSRSNKVSMTKAGISIQRTNCESIVWPFTWEESTISVTIKNSNQSLEIFQRMYIKYILRFLYYFKYWMLTREEYYLLHRMEYCTLLLSNKLDYDILAYRNFVCIYWTRYHYINVLKLILYHTGNILYYYYVGCYLWGSIYIYINSLYWILSKKELYIKLSQVIGINYPKEGRSCRELVSCRVY